MVVEQKKKSVREEQTKMRKDHCSLIVGLYLTQKMLEQVKKELRVWNILIMSLREAAKTRRRDGGGQEKRSGRVT